MTNSACPNRQLIQDYCLGRLTADVEESIGGHIAMCSSCEQVAGECDREFDPLVHALRSSSDESASSGDPYYQRALGRVKRFMRSGDRFTPPPDQTELVQLREYRLLRKLGEGGMGTVYKALHTRLDRVVALKVLPPERVRDKLAVARFQREMRAAGIFDHPAIVRATDAGDSDGTHFLVMEYVEGIDGSTLVDRIGPLEIADACEIIRLAAEGLQHVHERGLVHRDIKPSNLMVTPQGQVKILDLGLALIEEQAGVAHELTTLGQFLGTLDYMAPEQADDSHVVDARADIYSLGASLYKLLVGSPPYSGDEYNSPLKKFRALAMLPVRPIAERRADIPCELAAIVGRMLAKLPSERFASASEIAEALRPFCEGSHLQELVTNLKPSEDIAESEPVGLQWMGTRRSNAPFSGVNALAMDDAALHSNATGVRSPGRIWLYAGLAALLLMAAGLIIRVQTDKGDLVIESSEPGVEVLIRQSGKTVEDMELQQGPNRTTLRSGTYEVVLQGETDGLTVHDNRFTLTRGGEHVATIERTALANAENTASAHGKASNLEPTYDGMTFDEWAHRLRFERKPESAMEAMLALGALGNGKNAAEAVSLIIDEAKKGSDQWTLDDSLEGQKNQAACSALQQLDSVEGVAALSNALRNETPEGRMYAMRALDQSRIYSIPTRTVKGKGISREHARLAIPALLEASRDKIDTVRRKALWLATELAWSNDTTTEMGYAPDAALKAEIMQRLREALNDESEWIVLNAAQSLVNHAPETEELVPALMKLIQDELRDSANPFVIGRAIDCLGQLGARAAPAVPILTQILSLKEITELQWHSDRGMQPDATGGGFGGGFDGGFVGTTQTVGIATLDALAAIGPAANAPEVIAVVRLYVADLRGVRVKRANTYQDPLSTVGKEAETWLNRILPTARPENVRTSHNERDNRVPTLDVEHNVRNERGASGERRDEALARREGQKLEPTYNGKTFDEWVHRFKVERNPESAMEAMAAIAILGNGENAASAVSLIIEEGKKVGDPWTLDNSLEGQMKQAGCYALQQLDSVEGVRALSDALRKENAVGRTYVWRALQRDAWTFPKPIRGLWKKPISREHARLAVPALIDASRDENANVRWMTLSLAGELAFIDNTAAAATSDDSDASFKTALVKRLQEVLQDESNEVVLEAARFLVVYEPDTDGLVPALVELVGKEFEDRKIPSPAGWDTWLPIGSAMDYLAELGPRAAPAIPLLVSILSDVEFAERNYSKRALPDGSGLQRGGGFTHETRPIGMAALKALAAIGPAANTPEVRAVLPRYKGLSGGIGHLPEASREVLYKILSEGTQNKGKQTIAPDKSGTTHDVPDSE